MEAPDVFHQYHLTIDPATKAVSAADPSLVEEIQKLNEVHRGFIALEAPHQVPPPPVPVNPKRTAALNKLKDAGNASFKKGQHGEAVKMYELAIRLASERPAWEPAGLVREELVTLYNNRAAALMAQQHWPEAAVDAETAVELKKLGNVKAWWRRGQCLREMGRLEEAEAWVRDGLEFERAGPERASIGELEALARDIAKALGK